MKIILRTETKTYECYNCFCLVVYEKNETPEFAKTIVLGSELLANYYFCPNCQEPKLSNIKTEYVEE